MKPISSDKYNQIVYLLQQGYSYNRIREVVEVSKSTISMVANQNGYGTIYKELTPEIITEATYLYHKIHNIKKVAKIVGVSYERLVKVVDLIKGRRISNYTHVKRNRHRNRRWLINYKGGKCVLCGYNHCTTALELHHLDPSKKEMSFNVMNTKLSRLIEEADKCILVCANCHREIHAGYHPEYLLVNRNTTEPKHI